MLAQLRRGAHSDKEFWPKAKITHTPGASATTHRMADKDIHPAQRALNFPEFAPEIDDGEGSWRFSMSRLVHGIAIETGGGKGFAATK